VYKEWIEKSINEKGSLDYFEFADLCQKQEDITNSHYKTVLENPSSSNKSYVTDIANASNK
jgi:hypothetical protein